MSDSHPTMTYPSEEQYTRWQVQADKYGMSMSEFVECMVEAGLKKFNPTTTPDETNRELRDHRNDLKNELDHARSRIDQLEDRLHHGERADIRDFINANPGATYEEIVQHCIDTTPRRVTSHLDSLEGESISTEGEQYYPVDDGEVS